MSRFLLVVAFLFSILPAGAQDMRAMRLPLDREPLVFATAHGKATFGLEIARTEEQRERGLMWRSDFPKDRAMLFVFGETRSVMMWMKNTPIPLDMVFLDAQGRVSAITEGAKPFSETIISSEGPAAYVVELLAGTVKHAGIRRGDRAIHKAICGACRP